jgi:allantoate deiminase
MQASTSPFAARFAPARVQQYIDELGTIGAHPDGGLYRGLYTPAWAAAMDRMEAWLRELGLETRRDAVGNLFGRLAGTASARVVLSGSHIDTVKQGGKYDGALGAIAAMLAISALRDAYGPPRKTLEVYVICEEEGSRFPGNFWGSRALTGQIGPDEPERLRDADGITLAEAMQALGLDPAAIPTARRDDLDAFVELHIEQGRLLEEGGYDLGVVETITGQRQLRVRVTGRQDHAGTTPMDLRRDALAGAAEMIARLTDAAAAMGRPAVATSGMIAVQPGAINIVPRAAQFTVDTRHPDPERRRALIAQIETILQEVAARRGLGLEVERLTDHEPTPMAPALRDLIAEAADAEGLRWLAMPSGAGHDSQILARHVPTAMVFVPSRDGRSHCPEEFTPIEQIVPGLRVLARVLHRLAY